ncbi:MAG TPA: SDR family NAD(P)-dependent oxidoreductase [Candidatus Kapabacteria bacterium]|jgi:uncharacterized oxidoreductase|nr:SDR family NAD(P)-dependent oxidoreductase [Candidatus Kapabacteria bacterium]
MKLTDNRILITGGATGIGFALAEEFLKRGNTVLVCGRREEKLREAASKAPGLQTKLADISDPNDRKSLAEWGISNGVNILVNNAGMQREIDFTRGIEALEEGDNEVRINLEGTIYLTALFLPYLFEQDNAAILNVSSGLGFVPIAIMPVYCATKAAIHSFTISLRHQLTPAGLKVFEVIPPTVDTDLDRGAREKRGQIDRGISAEDVAAAVIEGMQNDRPEIAIGIAANLVGASKTPAFDTIFQRMNAPRG